jgi:hypothetical protein
MTILTVGIAIAVIVRVPMLANVVGLPAKGSAANP